MMSKAYINGLGVVSTQETFNPEFDLNESIPLSETVNYAQKANYKEYIKPAALRRMAKGIKMGVFAANKALQEAEVNNPEAIITGTGFGCIIDSEKFLLNIINNNEEFLTPTSFIQSTHNTIGGQIALGLNCHSYNMTYVQEANSFESSLIDGLLMMKFENKNDLLIGGVDEIGEVTSKLLKEINVIKSSNDKGAIWGEGAYFFLLQNTKNSNTYAEVLDCETYMKYDKEDAEKELTGFLSQNKLNITDIDIIILGNNGDFETDIIYDEFADTNFKNTCQLKYKHICGENYTSTGFSGYLSAKILKNQEIPSIYLKNEISVKKIKTILVFNHFKSDHYSFTLYQLC